MTVLAIGEGLVGEFGDVGFPHLHPEPGAVAQLHVAVSQLPVAVDVVSEAGKPLLAQLLDEEVGGDGAGGQR